MDWKKLLLPPVAIYAVIFLFISALVGAKVNAEATWVWIVSLLITIAGLYLATNYVKPKNTQEGLKYGAIWLVILIILDLILTMPFTGAGYFSDWKSYIPYALTLVMPMILVGRNQNRINGY